MLKVHVVERLAAAAGLVPPDRPARHSLSLGITAMVLAAVVGLMTLYAGVRELAQSDSVYDGSTASRPASVDSPAKLMSDEDMRRLADED